MKSNASNDVKVLRDLGKCVATICCRSILSGVFSSLGGWEEILLVLILSYDYAGPCDPRQGGWYRGITISVLMAMRVGEVKLRRSPGMAEHIRPSKNNTKRMVLLRPALETQSQPTS